MNKTLTNLFIFTAGAAIGSVVTWKLVKDKYSQLAQKEVEEIREYYANLSRGDEESPNEGSTDISVSGIPEFDEQDRVDYANLANVYASTTEEGGAPVMCQKPEVITPAEFGEYGYPTVSLTLYADGVLEDEYFDVIPPEDIDAMVGLESLTHFGEYEDDSVFVRNDRLETDFEILRDTRNYADIPKNSPGQRYD